MSHHQEAKRAFAVQVVTRLRQAGHQALWAGGCVRDLLMGHEPADYDVATSATPEQVMDLFARTVPVGVSFGVVRVQGPRESGEVEVATFRSDDAYIDGRRPVSVTYSSPEQDAARRDFTINGMFLDPLTDEVIDFVNGRADLSRGVVRAIGDPGARFAEDKLRLLRAVRFTARFGFELDPETRNAVQQMAEQVHVVAPERICQELRRILIHESRATGMQLVKETGILSVILPEVAALQGEPDTQSGDSWVHTFRVLELLPKQVTFPLALAALLHDTGKPMARAEYERSGHEASHERLGRRITDDLGRDLKLSNAERERTSWLVGSHHALEAVSTFSHARIKRWLAHPGYPELELLIEANQTARLGSSPDATYCRWYLQELPGGPIDPPTLLTGADLIECGLKPGPDFSRLLEEVREAQLNLAVSTKSQALELLDQLRAKG